MAGSRTPGKVNRRRERAVYLTEGSVARAAEYVPEGRRSQRHRSGKSVAARRRTRRRAGASATGVGYAAFILLISFLTVAACIGYLKKKATITNQVEINEELASELSNLKSENAALEEELNNSIDWDHVRDVAINRLGMKYASKDQVVWYNTDDNSYIVQYKKVPSGD